MKNVLPFHRVGFGLVMSLLTLGFAGHVSAQTPSSATLRAKTPPPATACLTTPADDFPRLDAELKRIATQAVATSKSRGMAPTTSELKVVSPSLSFAQGTAGPKVLVQITAADVNALLPALQAAGFEVRYAYPNLHLVEGLLPVSALTASGSTGVDGLVSKGLLGVSGVARPVNNVGIVTSQADYVLEAARARAYQPKRIMGKGVTVGVLSNSFNALGGAATDVATGDLPTVNVLNDYSGEDDEGRAMCQLVYDLAPGVNLAFNTAYNSEGTFAQHIRDLADPTKGNCKVIVDDVSYFEEPFFQDGLIAQAVTDVVANQGVSYFSSAGNNASSSYENRAPQFVAGPAGTGQYLNFDVTGAVTDIQQPISIPNGQTLNLVLQWSDPFYTNGGVKTDLDMYLVSLKNNVVADTVFRGTGRNILTSRPLERIGYTNNSTTSGTTTFALIIRLRSGAVPTILKYINFANGAPVAATKYLTNSSTIVGHTAAAEAASVAAVRYYNQRVPESFTSRGGAIPILFSPTGVALPNGTTRQKPNMASIDGTNTTFFGGNDLDADGFQNFFGTSAAAPHAAAVAALLLSSEPTLTPTQVYTRLVGSARLLGTTATDPLTGPGLIDAFTALYGPVAATAPPVFEDLEKQALPTNWLIYGTGAARAQVTSQAPASGQESLILDAYPTITTTSISSLDEATLYLQNAASNNLTLTFRERKFVAETDEQMPATFQGHSNTDGVALSVDGGTNWYRIFDLTGTGATTSYQTQTVNLSQFATTNSLTLGNDVRIKFQRFGRGGSTATVASNQAGRAFDDIVINNSAAPAPVALYAQSPAPAIGCPGLQVQYTDTSLYKPTAWSWSFPGGTPATSTARNPLVTYNTPGHYGVSLTVTNAIGTAMRADTGVVFVQGRAPIATVTTSTTSICKNGTVTFGSTAQYCPATYAWSFPGGSPATSTAANPGAVTYATAGTYTATLTVANSFGSNTYSVIIDVNGRPLPYAENFEGSTTLPRGWTLVTPSTYYWSLANNIIGRNGARSRTLLAPFGPDPNVGERPAVYTPAIDLSTTTQPTLLFDVAYATFTDGTTGTVFADSLIVQVADACAGTVLGRVYAKGKADLPTHATLGDEFVPASGNDWRQERVDLSAYAGKQVIIRFVGYNGFGNNLYLDNVQIGANLLSLTSKATAIGFEAWPVPAPGGSSLNVRLPAYSGALELRLLDAVGRVVWRQQLTQSGAALERTLPLPAAAGAYTLLYQPANGAAAARKLLVQ